MSPPSPIAVAAIVGTGFIAPVHIEALRRLGIPLRGILGSDAPKSRLAADRLSLPVAYDSYASLLADREVSVVHITSPNRHHREQVLGALAAGKHVICEKPLGMDRAETAALVAAARAHPHLVCAVNYNVRFYPVMLHARELLASGAFGEIFHVHGSYEQDWLLKPTDFNWRVLTEEGGELRAVSDIGTHWMDLCAFVTGLRVQSVLADLRTVHPQRLRPASGSAETFSGPQASPPDLVPIPIATDDYAAILLRFANGARGCVTVSQVTAGRKNCIRLEVAAAKGSFAWDSEKPDFLWQGSRDEPNRLHHRNPGLMGGTSAHFSDYPAGHAEGYPDTFKQLYRAIYADIAAGRPSQHPLYATFEDAHHELAFCDAVSASAREGRWVDIAP
jgi:predicted dehydrogenase